MRSLLRKAAFASATLAAMLSLAACGESHTKQTGGTYAGESGKNAPYLNVGPLVYQVQLSRELNPFDTEDSAYLRGLTPAQRALEPGQEWFAVFIQVYNDQSVALTASSELTVTDTQGNTYTPVLPDATNEFAFRAGQVPANGRLPIPGSVAADGPTQGALLLYKIQIASLDNRPLTLHIVDPAQPSERAAAELDV